MARFPGDCDWAQYGIFAEYRGRQFVAGKQTKLNLAVPALASVTVTADGELETAYVGDVGAGDVPDGDTIQVGAEGYASTNV